MSERRDTYSYKGWLNSNSFLKRALAVYGYSLIGSLIIIIPLIILFFFFIFLIGLFSA